MPIFLKQLELNNFCGFRHLLLDFTRNGKVRPFTLFFSPNGTGKSTILHAVNILSFPWQYIGRESDLLFRKLTFHPDYNPNYVGFAKTSGMKAQATFSVDGQDKQVILENSANNIGVSKCEIEKRLAGNAGHAFFTDADNPMNTSRFQLNQKYEHIFLDIAESVYGYHCELPKGNFAEVEERDSATGEYVTFYTDFTIHKPFNDTIVHFKSMSAGEKKIATLLAMLCNPLYLDNFDIFLIDNFSLHVYYTRHARMLEKFLEHFPNKQFLLTDHSGTLIEYAKQNYPENICDLEKQCEGALV